MALAVIWLSVALGVVLGLWQRIAARATGPIRTFAVVAAGVLVALSLLPHAILSEGLAGLGVALASVALVPLLERLVRVPFRSVSAEWLRLELGFAGLLVHRFGDGVVMSVEGHGSELSWAVGAHEVPIVALVVLAYARRRGYRQALLRALLLGLASSFGFWLVHVMPGRWHELHGWVDAVAAGILVHILAYEALPEPLETARERTIDGLGAALGLCVVLLPGLDEHSDAPRVAEQLLATSLAAAPWLLAGLVASAAWLARAPARTAASPRPVLARPWPGLDAFALAGGLAGGWIVAAWLVAGAVLAGFGQALLARLPAPPPLEAGHAHSHAPPAAETGFWPALDDRVLRVAGWVALGLLAQSYILAFTSEAPAFASLDGTRRGLLVAAVALPAALCSAGAVPLAVALLARGLSPALVVAGLALGPVLASSARQLGRRPWSAAASTLGLCALGLGWIALAVWLDARFGRWLPGSVYGAGPALPGALGWLALAALAVLVARSVWRVGVRGWLGVSLRALGITRSGHAHAH